MADATATFHRAPACIPARRPGRIRGHVTAQASAEGGALLGRRRAAGCLCGCGLALVLPQRAGAVVPTSWSDPNFAIVMSKGMNDYERLMRPLKCAVFAEALPPGAALLEIGLGTGPNLGCYGTASRVVGLEPNTAMHGFARTSAAAAGLDNFSIVTGVAESLPFAEASFDVVVATMVLCSVRDMVSTLAEVRRVLKPGGRYIFIEHVSAPASNAPLRAAQAMLDPLQVALADNCHLTRDPMPLIEAGGFFSSVNAARFSLDDARAIEIAAAGGSAIAALRRAAADGGAGWRVGEVMKPHFLLSPHCIGMATV
jgi:SAM-dependent methyltransferase